MKKEFARGSEAVAVDVEPLGDERYRVRVGERVFAARAVALPTGGVQLQFEGEPASVVYGAQAGKAFQVRYGDHTWLLQAPAGRVGVAAGADGKVRAPMTGTVLEVGCKVGDRVVADQTLVVLSAMKMEHKLDRGPRWSRHCAFGRRGQHGGPGCRPRHRRTRLTRLKCHR